jgi:UDP-N-acetylmuramoyl-tripeptide--D-alanyl-D-alanine ligase
VFTPLEARERQVKTPRSLTGFKISELLKATQGRLVSGNDKAVVEDVAIDSRKIKKNAAFIAIKGNNFDGHDFIGEAIKKGASCVITKKRIKKLEGVAVIEVKDTTRALGDIARFNRMRYNVPVIVVTGSNGKTTTKDMIAHVLSKKFRVLKNEGTKNNHIGLPMALLKLDNSYDAAVLEVGTNHFGEVKYLSEIACANIGVITNIGPSHLEYLESLNGVFREKYDLVRNLKDPAIAILNADDNYLRRELAKKKNKPFLIGVGVEKRADYSAYSIRNLSGKCSFNLNKRLEFALNVPGYYNIHNSLIAIAVARIFGVEHRVIAKAFLSFKLPKGRLNFLKKKGVRFINDTYNSNPLSLRQALGLLKEISVKGRKIVVMGDMLELGNASINMHAQAIADCVKVCDNLVIVGKIGSSSLKGAHQLKANVISCKDSLQAQDILINKIAVGPDDIVLVKGSRMMKMEEVFNY